jgi:hypothetical protein
MMHVSAQVSDDHLRAPANLVSATYLGTWIIALAILNALVTRYELLRIYQCTSTPSLGQDRCTPAHRLSPLSEVSTNSTCSMEDTLRQYPALSA